MTLDQADAIAVAAENLGLNAEVRWGYSGRGMFGAKTIGVTTDRKVSGTLLGRIIANAMVAAGDGFLDVRTDDMGLGTILY